MALTLLENIGLADSATTESTSTICEPTAAANNAQLFMTGNWFASRSVNGGATWSHVNPYTSFPASAGGFCCDQVVLYNARHRIWIWLLQYSTGANGENLFRIAISREATFGSWYYYDFTPRGVNAAWAGDWYDYPDMAFTDANLFITFNMFRGNTWRRAVVFRFPLATLAAGGAVSYRQWATTSNGSIRLCRGPGATMFMGSHNNTTQLRVFSWPDTAAAISFRDVNVRSWAGGAYTAPGPGGINWLARTDPRITGAWVGAGTLGFMWTANRDATHPLPYIRCVRVRQSSLTLLDEPDIWSTNAAWAYPAAAANAQGVAGFTAFYGGGAQHPGHVVGIRNAASWSTTLTRVSSHGPPDQSWGDYLSCTPHHGSTGQWVASGYTLQGGGLRRNIEPRYVRFRA